MLTHNQSAAPSRPVAANRSDLRWTRSQLVKACAHGDVAGIAAVGLTVQFLLRDGLSRGYLVRNDGGVQRFENDKRAWAYIEQIHARAKHPAISSSRSPSRFAS